MVRVVYDLDVYEGYAAAKSDSDIWIYDENWREIRHISGIYGDEWNFIHIENGDWTDISDIPNPEDVMQNRITQLESDLAAAQESLRQVTEQYETAAASGSALQEQIEEIQIALTAAENNLRERTLEYQNALSAAEERAGAKESLVGVLSGHSVLKGTLSVPSNDIYPEESYPKLIGKLTIPMHYGEAYQGSYEVVPTSGFQLLNTEEKFMKEDILVHPIPYAEVSNPSGGYTAIFGG